MILSHCSELWLYYNKSDDAGVDVVCEWLDRIVLHLLQQALQCPLAVKLVSLRFSHAWHGIMLMLRRKVCCKRPFFLFLFYKIWCVTSVYWDLSYFVFKVGEYVSS